VLFIALQPIFKPLFCRYLGALVFLLGIFRRAPCPSDTRGTLVPFSFPGGALPLKKNKFKNLKKIIYW
jgi:hypothetical protein